MSNTPSSSRDQKLEKTIDQRRCFVCFVRFFRPPLDARIDARLDARLDAALFGSLAGICRYGQFLFL
jgi:hypothetical protein